MEKNLTVIMICLAREFRLVSMILKFNTKIVSNRKFHIFWLMINNFNTCNLSMFCFDLHTVSRNYWSFWRVRKWNLLFRFIARHVIDFKTYYMILNSTWKLERNILYVTYLTPATFHRQLTLLTLSFEYIKNLSKYLTFLS